MLLAKEAADDLKEMHNYITDSLKEYKTADEYLKMLRKAIQSLDEMPLRCRGIDSEPFKSMQLRRLVVKNFYVYYTVDSVSFVVNVVNVRGVIYSHREQSVMYNR